MSFWTVVGTVAAAVTVIALAYWLDEKRNATGRTAWQGLRHRFVWRRPARQRTPVAVQDRRRVAPWLIIASVLAIVLVGVVALRSAPIRGALASTGWIPGLSGAGAVDAAGDDTLPVSDVGPLEGAAFDQDPSYMAAIAAAVSQQVFPEGNADEVVLVRDRPTGDALAAGSLVGVFDTTLLLTDSRELSPITRAEIDRLGNPRVHILGGPDAVSTDIEEGLVRAGHDVHRHAGPTLADTAVDMIGAHFPDAQSAVLVQTPDATTGPVRAVSLALVATSYAAAEDLPILMTSGDELSDVTGAYLRDSAIRDVVVIGNERDISPAVTSDLEQLGVTVRRWTGETRFDTAVTVAQERGWQTLQSGDSVILVEGGHDSVWPAGFLGTLQASYRDGPVLLTQGTELPVVTASYLSGAADGVDLVCTPGVTSAACGEASRILGLAGAG